MNKNDFLYPRNNYRGEFTTNNLLFNTNLQEFAQKVSYISALHTGGKLSAKKAYQQMEQLWQKLKHSKQLMNIN